MATYAQLEAEVWWGREYAPPRLEALYQGVRAYLRRGPDAVGGKGDNAHLRGYHRSREWILNSRWSLYGSQDYSVVQALDRGGDPRWLSAMDATPRDTETLIAMCQRLDRAVRADELPQVREWYGNLNGDIVVDGWDAVRRQAATSDSSHLWHLHISLYRSRADWDHTHLLRVLTGEDDDVDVYYKIQSADKEWNGRVYVSNRIHRRGPLRGPGNIQGPATAEAKALVLTDAMRGTEAWESYLTAVAGPPFPAVLGDAGAHAHGVTVNVTGTVPVTLTGSATTGPAQASGAAVDAEQPS